MVLRGIFGAKKDGFYVDIGAHHPIYFSNTYHFYLKGWRGINIEATPEVISQFNQLRKKDLNLNVCIGPESGKEVTFFEFDQPALNTTIEDVANESEKRGFKLTRKRKMTTQNINEIIKANLPSGKEIDFLSIDIEGLDEMVLGTLDFDKYKPKVIVVEEHKFNMAAPKSTMMDVLLEKDYILTGKCGPSLIFKRKDQE
jgi:FkbM family methyltransferase